MQGQVLVGKGDHQRKSVVADLAPSTSERESWRGNSSGVLVRLSGVFAIMDAVVWLESECDDGGGDLGFYHPRW